MTRSYYFDQQVTVYSMFVAVMAFFAKVINPMLKKKNPL